jgi:hypothetical protein
MPEPVASVPERSVELDGFMDLATAIAVLREQLLAAQSAGEAQAATSGRSVSFGVGKVEVEFTVEAKSTGGGGVGVRFGVFSADAKADHTRGQTHKVKLELQPIGPDGQTLKVASSQRQGPPGQ